MSNRRLTRHDLVVVDAAGLLRELMPLVGEDLPERVVGWRDRGGRIRRVRADYPSGWRVQVRFDAAGCCVERGASVELEGYVGQAVAPIAYALGGSTVADSDGDDGA